MIRTPSEGFTLFLLAVMLLRGCNFLEQEILTFCSGSLTRAFHPFFKGEQLVSAAARFASHWCICGASELGYYAASQLFP